jgi:hypothetical protein
MDKVLRPECLETDPNSNTAATEWQHWKRTFENFLSVLPRERLDKFGVLTNFVSPTVFQYIEESEDYTAAIAILEALFVKPCNKIYARHLLATRRQRTNETLDEYLQVLKTLRKDCNFKNATAVQYRDESIQDAFITGLLSNLIRQRFLENKTLDLKTMFDQARSLESAMKSYGLSSKFQCYSSFVTTRYTSVGQSRSEFFGSFANRRCILFLLWK